ncbi:nuclear transport factor 2 family protein [Aureimonas glaciei]|uniref:SnoaL-like domain-containing protein n=1 Tax=Aureimonas glaciei TaxID=1776957 RepID=A0A916Y0V0_9HYPH|nr:nuclear transport factor 2 family protein [Aureimonas glaciei]GGD26259.1 hypothetical protein GCM10011335_31630 [Aureimonas glaciei]
MDFDRLLQTNLLRVFGERDAEQRIQIIRELYVADAVLYEPGSSATGHAEINRAVDALLSSLPPGFAFSALGPAVGHHGMARLRWQLGLPGGPVAVSGTDVACFDGDLIQTLHVFIDPDVA